MSRHLESRFPALHAPEPGAGEATRGGGRHQKTSNLAVPFGGILRSGPTSNGFANAGQDHRAAIGTREGIRLHAESPVQGFGLQYGSGFALGNHFALGKP